MGWELAHLMRVLLQNQPFCLKDPLVGDGHRDSTVRDALLLVGRDMAFRLCEVPP